MTSLCAAIFVDTETQALRDAALAAEAGADLIEYRIDRITDAAALPHLVARSALPCVVTCRPTWEGGESRLGDAERIRLCANVADHTSYVDVELKAIQAGQKPSERWIVSSHDFSGRPSRLNSIVLALNESGAAVNKIVWTARTIRDNLEAFEVLQQRSRPTIALCMGEAGLISRVLAKKFGAFLSYAALDTGGGTAPGQLTISQMKRLYRWDAIGPATKVYGVVATPVAHSMSPAVHNAAFAHVGHDGVYLPMLVNGGYESFKAFMESFTAFASLDLAGLSVTIPHKENALRYLIEKGAEVEELARRIGAVNTIVIERDGPTPRLRGMNTDYAAILDVITGAMGITHADLRGRRVAVLGAGGTARTAVAALAHHGATVIVHNRTPERAQALADEFKATAAPLAELPLSRCDILVNATSVGMYPHVDATPVTHLGKPQLVFDTIYNPPRTKLLEQAALAGAKTVGGVEMFIRQAAGQFEAWTGKAAPLAIMRQALEQGLFAADADERR